MDVIDWLGPVELRRAGGVLPLSVRKCLALLVLLAREGTMPRERVVALLWPTLDLSTGRRNLRRELARLRDAGAAELVQAQGDQLAIGADVQITALAFEDWLRRGRPDDALALWRGPPADGLHLEGADAWDEWVVHERRRMDGLRGQALALSAAQFEAAGDLSSALDRIRVLLAIEPLQEHHHLAAMRLLDRLGQPAAALAQFETCVQLLADELGLAPMAQTRALAAAIRTPAGAAASYRPTAAEPAPGRSLALLPEVLPFVGREREVAHLERAWHTGRPILIEGEGEGGIGKTRLVSDFAAAHGPYAIVGCRAGDAELPLASFTRALRALAGPAPALHELPEWVRDELARLMPEWGRAPLPLRSEDERARFAKACALAWQHWAAGNFDAVVIDDWHLADAGSQALWTQIHSAAESLPRLVLVYRPGLSPAAAERLQRELRGGATHLRLEPLPEEAVLALVQRLSGRPEPRRFASMLARATDGHPFYMAETLRHLVERGLLTAASDGRWCTPYDEHTAGHEELPLPDSVRGAVLARVARLPERGQRLLEAAALADEPFDAALLAPACALSEVEATLALEEALQARLLREADRGGLAFVHHLVQQALESALGPVRRRSVHRRLALGAAAAGAPAARIAAHHEAGGEARRAVPWRLRAGDEALRLHALDDALAQWRRALDDGPDPAEALRIRMSLVRALETRDLIDEARQEATLLLQLIEQGAGSPALRIEAQIAVAYLYARRDGGAQALALLDALPPTTEPRLRAAALNARSTAMHKLDRPAEACALAEAALATEGLGPDERGRALESLINAKWYLGEFREALALVGQSRALADAVQDRLGTMRAIGREGAILTQLRDLVTAEARLREAAALADTLGMVAYRRNTLFNLCVLQSEQCQHQALLETARTCWALKPPMPLDMQRVLVRMAFAEAHVALGDLGAARGWALGGIDDALALGRAFGAAAVGMTSSELLAVLGESQRLAPLLALLESPDAKVVQVARETWISTAECALMAGQQAAGRAARQRVVDADGIENPRIRMRLAIVDAALVLGDGDAAGALAQLPPDAAPELNDELRARVLAVRLRAESAGPGCSAATLAAADAALGLPGAHALAALALHRALLAVASTPERQRGWQQRVRALAATLHDAPPVRAQFEQRWLDLG